MSVMDVLSGEACLFLSFFEPQAETTVYWERRLNHAMTDRIERSGRRLFVAEEAPPGRNDLKDLAITSGGRTSFQVAKALDEVRWCAGRVLQARFDQGGHHSL
ncbi:hypothetical protein [uncultured Methylobacterium sp.]|jgi:hypothetical protein|uniref:hypothetical protein n=1 Tax=uncultured Methylobacterium sp. TaxID=157278 RepID=UPI0026126370|nr:hypothetical protein [uncultured Methylobacterium sp.]